MEMSRALEAAMIRQRQLQKFVWTLVRLAGGEIVIDEATIDPLWDLTYSQVEESKTALRVTAGKLLEPTSAQIAELARRLVGTAKNPVEEAAMLGFVDYPLSYWSECLKTHLDFTDKIWTPKTAAPSTNGPNQISA